MSVQQIRAERLGLSNNLFCNKARHAAKIKRDGIVIRTVGGNPNGNTEGLQRAREAVKERGYNGSLSKARRSKLVSMLAAWVEAIKSTVNGVFSSTQAAARKFTFVTLTLPAEQAHTDNYLKRHALGRFLQECKREHGATTHFWRAETQRNGNLHFHVLFQVFMPWKWLRATWNNIMSDLGYIQCYAANQKEKHKNGFTPSRPDLTPEQKKKETEAYHKGMYTNWTDPNSTDIHALYKVKNAAAYVCKYVAKESEGRKVEGRIWGCTDQLRELKEPEIGVEDEFIKLCSELANTGRMKRKQYDNCTIYTGTVAEILEDYAPELLQAVKEYYSDISKWLSTFDKIEQYNSNNNSNDTLNNTTRKHGKVQH